MKIKSPLAIRIRSIEPPLAKGFGDDRERRTREGVNPLASPTGSLSRIIAQDEWVR
jgi:hypothetical protein